ncbi:MAG: DoxX family protein [Alphaproteobacteria bacterium]
MHADHSVLQIIAHVMIASLFLYRGFGAMPQYAHHAGRLRSRRVPFPEVVMVFAFATMIAGGVMVALDFHAWIGASLLILFTLLANFLYHDFWNHEPGRDKERSTNSFANNIAVMGGLLLVFAAS